MRSILLALLAFPVAAQSPVRAIDFRCDEEHCLIKKADMEWLIRSTQAKDKALQLCGLRDI